MLNRVMPGWGSDIPAPELDDLIGAEILDIGFVPGWEDEGGFAIDYKKEDNSQRIVFGFTELGMWIAQHRPLSEDVTLCENLEDLIDKILEGKTKKDWYAITGDLRSSDDPLRLRIGFEYRKTGKIFRIALPELNKVIMKKSQEDTKELTDVDGRLSWLIDQIAERFGLYDEQTN